MIIKKSSQFLLSAVSVKYYLKINQPRERPLQKNMGTSLSNEEEYNARKEKIPLVDTTKVCSLNLTEKTALNVPEIFIDIVDDEDDDDGNDDDDDSAGDEDVDDITDDGNADDDDCCCDVDDVDDIDDEKSENTPLLKKISQENTILTEKNQETKMAEDVEDDIDDDYGVIRSENKSLLTTGQEIRSMLYSKEKVKMIRQSQNISSVLDRWNGYAAKEEESKQTIRCVLDKWKGYVAKEEESIQKQKENIVSKKDKRVMAVLLFATILEAGLPLEFFVIFEKSSQLRKIVKSLITDKKEQAEILKELYSI